MPGLDRRYWLTVVVLAVLVAASTLLVWITRERPDEQIFAGPPRSDYTLTNFTLNALDADGKRTFRIVGPRLSRDGNSGDIFVETPDYLLVDGSGHPWTGKSDAAWVNKDGSVMKLQGHVEMHRAGDAKSMPLDLVTTDLTTWPKAKKMETSAPATITQGNSILRGTGLRGDLDDKTLELLSDVHSILLPKQAHSAAQ